MYKYTEWEPEQIETHTYGYNDITWRDLLTSYDGQSITYDAIGNPLSILQRTAVYDGLEQRAAVGQHERWRHESQL